MIAAREGIGVEITPAVAGRIADATLVARWGGSTRTYPIALFPSTVAGETTCVGDGPNDSCSVQARETGGKNGFADIQDLPSTPVEITMTFADPGGTESGRGTLRVTPKDVYPNGPDCGADGPQTNLIFDGTLRERT
jgi:hypothetical protein